MMKLVLLLIIICRLCFHMLVFAGTDYKKRMEPVEIIC